MAEFEMNAKDLLVFGYACKLFRDDERAAYIDAGKHLIPWMDDETMKIDRYDVRGTVFDLKLVEVPSNGYERFEGLTKTEKKIEKQCDKERFRSLYFDEADDNDDDDDDDNNDNDNEDISIPQEASEDRKYAQVQYQYSDSNEKTSKSQCEEGEDELFVPSGKLPENLIVPKTARLNSVIEKTAQFIHKQGPQMEILMRMKQKDNALFDFLSIDNPLHKYYRYVLVQLKENEKTNSEPVHIPNDVPKHTPDSVITPNLPLKIVPLLPKVQSAPDVIIAEFPPNCSYSHTVKDVNKTDELSLIEVPPPDVKLLIDKLASHVAKNGQNFEDLIREKRDPRFLFLNPFHKFFPFYKSLVNKLISETNIEVQNSTDKEIDSVSAAIEKDDQLTIEKDKTVKQLTIENDGAVNQESGAITENGNEAANDHDLLLEKKRKAALQLVNLHLENLNKPFKNETEVKRKKI